MTENTNRNRILIIKTGALGDVLRTTSVLPGLRKFHGKSVHIVWVTSHAAGPLLEGLVGRGIDELLAVDPNDAMRIANLGKELASWGFGRILSFDDELNFCALATEVAKDDVDGRLVGAYLTGDGQRSYTDVAAPWFDMGLLSKHGKVAADQFKVQNTRSHPALYAQMLSIEAGEPHLEIAAAALEKARGRLARFLSEEGQLNSPGSLCVGLNTGAGGRWRSKALPRARVVALAVEIDRRFVANGQARPCFVMLGGPEERERNQRLMSELTGACGLRVLDGGCDNSLIDFAGLIDGLDLIVTSDSLALHMATARKVPIVAFFAPTSAAEIELYGRGQKVASTAPDYCSYAMDADTSSLTVERLAEAFFVVVRENLS